MKTRAKDPTAFQLDWLFFGAGCLIALAMLAQASFFVRWLNFDIAERLAIAFLTYMILIPATLLLVAKFFQLANLKEVALTTFLVVVFGFLLESLNFMPIFTIIFLK